MISAENPIDHGGGERVARALMQDHEDDPYILEVENLTKQFQGFLALDAVNLRIRRGNIHALIGPNGAGKTTCFNLITKFLRPTNGCIRLHGRDITHLGAADIARMGMVRSFQISAVFPHLTVLENVRVALQRKRGDSFDFWRSEEILNQYNEAAQQLIESVGLQSHSHEIAGELPYGRKRALELATTLALDPQVMLLDEPTAGMAHEDVQGIIDLIKRVSAARTVLMVEHNLSVVSSLSDWITVLARGRVLCEGDYATVSRDDSVIKAYLGGGRDVG